MDIGIDNGMRESVAEKRGREMWSKDVRGVLEEVSECGREGMTTKWERYIGTVGGLDGQAVLYLCPSTLLL